MRKFGFSILLISLATGLCTQPASAVDPTPWPGAATLNEPALTSNSTSTTAPTSSTSTATSSTGTPLQPATAGPGETPRFYTITAELRETYDDNVYTSTVNTHSAWETSLTPSILFNFPMENSDLSFRLTFAATNYAGETGNPTELTADFLARFTHQFSDRFAIDVRDETGYFTEPSLFNNVGTLFRDGGYISQTFSADFSAQWTPLVSSTTSFSNAATFYDDSVIASGQDFVENTVTQGIGFAILPKYTLTFDGTYNGISYNNDDSRGYTSCTGSTGINWSALPSLSLSANVGASYTWATDAGDAPSPYLSGSLAWQLGQRSHLALGYTYSIVPTDVTTASGQLASRTYASFSYDINRSFSTHLSLALTYSDYTSGLVQSNTTGPFTEWDSALDVGLSYHVSNHFDASIGYTFSDVSSQVSFRDYTRNQIYIGITGNY